MAKSKIFVFHLKEIIYTILFIVLGILLILLLIFMFFPGKDKKQETPASATEKTAVSYHPGTYHSSLTVNDTSLDISVTVSESEILNVAVTDNSDVIATMYPTLQSTADSLCNQIVEKQSTTDLTYPDDQQYTYSVLISTIEEALNQARI